MHKLIVAGSLFLALAHHHAPAPTITTPAPTSTPPASTTFQWGAYTGNTLASLESFERTVATPDYVGVFIGDGDSFSEDFPGFTLPLVVYWESNLTAAQIAAGQADSYLTQWAAEMKAYNHPIIFVPLDEMQGSWAPYSGNPTAFQSAWIHVYTLFHPDANVSIYFDPNNGPVNTIASYFPGLNYVDGCGLDGFNMGGQTWAQVFLPALPTIQSLCPGKPIWLLSTGSVAPQQQFISDMISGMKTYGLQGFVYFDASGNGGNFTLTAQAVSTLQADL